MYFIIIYCYQKQSFLRFYSLYVTMKFRENSTGNIKPPKVLFPYYYFQNSFKAAVTVFVLLKLSYLLFQYCLKTAYPCLSPCLPLLTPSQKRLLHSSLGNKHHTTLYLVLKMQKSPIIRLSSCSQEQKYFACSLQVIKEITVTLSPLYCSQLLFMHALSTCRKNHRYLHLSQIINMINRKLLLQNIGLQLLSNTYKA